METAAKGQKSANDLKRDTGAFEALVRKAANTVTVGFALAALAVQPAPTLGARESTQLPTSTEEIVSIPPAWPNPSGFPNGCAVELQLYLARLSKEFQIYGKMFHFEVPENTKTDKPASQHVIAVFPWHDGEWYGRDGYAGVFKIGKTPPTDKNFGKQAEIAFMNAEMALESRLDAAAPIGGISPVSSSERLAENWRSAGFAGEVPSSSPEIGESWDAVWRARTGIPDSIIFTLAKEEHRLWKTTLVEIPVLYWRAESKVFVYNPSVGTVMVNDKHKPPLDTVNSDTKYFDCVKDSARQVDDKVVRDKIPKELLLSSLR